MMPIYDWSLHQSSRFPPLSGWYRNARRLKLELISLFDAPFCNPRNLYAFSSATVLGKSNICWVSRSDRQLVIVVPATPPTAPPITVPTPGKIKVPTAAPAIPPPYPPAIPAKLSIMVLAQLFPEISPLHQSFKLFQASKVRLVVWCTQHGRGLRKVQGKIIFLMKHSYAF